MDNIEQFLATNGFARTTQRSYRYVLRRLIADNSGDLGEMGAADLAAWLDEQSWGGALRWTAMCTVKRYLRWAYGDEHPALSLVMRREESPPQRSLKLKQVEQLLRSFDTRATRGRRDLAMCTLMLDSGLRAAEVCRLEMRHVDHMDRSFRVLIKGGRWGSGSFSIYTQSCLLAWTADREAAAQPGIKTLFVSLGGKRPGTALSPYGLDAVVKKWGIDSEIGAMSPHDLRRTFATTAIRLGAPSRVVQAAGRWSNLTMVEHYTRTITAEDMDHWFPVEAAMLPKD